MDLSSTSEAPFTLGIIGSGFAARTLAAAAVRSTEVTHVLVAGGSRVVEICEGYQVSGRPTVDQLLCDVDAVAVATPHSTHRVYVEQALEKGIHVFCEKPFVTSTQDGEDLIRQASERGLKLSVNHFQRYRAPNKAVADFVQRTGVAIEGGQARLVEQRGPERWKSNPANRGFMFGYGVHVVDLLLWWLGVPCIEVTARSFRDGDSERSTSAILSFENGTEISVFTSDLGTSQPEATQPGRAQMTFELVTEHGVFDVDSYGSAVVRTPSTAQEIGRLDTWKEFESPVRLRAYREAVDQFVRASRDGEEPDLTAIAALNAVRVCDAIERSASQRGRPTCV